MKNARIFQFLPLAFIAFLVQPDPGVSQGTISAELEAKWTTRANKEAANYAKSGYQVYGSDSSLEELIREFYILSYSEEKKGVRMFVNPTSMSREKDLEYALEKAAVKSKNNVLGIMQLYFYSWINVDDRTTQEQKQALIRAAELAEPGLAEQLVEIKPYRKYTFVKEGKKDFKVELRELYDQEMLKTLFRKAILEQLDLDQFEGKNPSDLLQFEK